MKAILGKKSGMTQYFDANSVAHAVTIISFAEMTVIGHKTIERDGYTAIVVGYGTQKPHRVSKSVKGQYKDGTYFKIQEFRVDSLDGLEIGKVLGVDQFAAGDMITVSGISKGKGFQGAVKLHGFKGKGSIHNAKHAFREVGSIGGGGRAGGRVVRGKKMPGRMGADRITVKNLRVVAVDADTKTMLVRGAVPGNPGGIVELVA